MPLEYGSLLMHSACIVSRHMHQCACETRTSTLKSKEVSCVRPRMSSILHVQLQYVRLEAHTSFACPSLAQHCWGEL